MRAVAALALFGFFILGGGCAPAGESAEGTMAPFGTWLVGALSTILFLCVVAFVLFVLVVLFLLWQAKRLVENAVHPDLPKLQRRIERLQAKHPDLDEDQLAKKVISGSALRTGFVGLITGVGGLPAMPIMLPIDLAASMKIQTNMIFTLRLLKATGEVEDDDVYSQASLWALMSGGQQLTTTASTAVRELVVKSAVKSVIKFVPLIGGVVGFALNWFSTQAMGRGTLVWEAKKIEPSSEG